MPATSYKSSTNLPPIFRNVPPFSNRLRKTAQRIGQGDGVSHHQLYQLWELNHSCCTWKEQERTKKNIGKRIPGSGPAHSISDLRKYQKKTEGVQSEAPRKPAWAQGPGAENNWVYFQQTGRSAFHQNGAEKACGQQCSKSDKPGSTYSSPVSSFIKRILVLVNVRLLMCFNVTRAGYWVSLARFLVFTWDLLAILSRLQKAALRCFGNIWRCLKTGYTPKFGQHDA